MLIVIAQLATLMENGRHVAHSCLQGSFVVMEVDLAI